MPEVDDTPAQPYAVLGEVRTGLVAHHAALPRAQAEQLLGLLTPGESILSWERPIARSRSGTLVTGLDCALAVGGQRARNRAVGTVVSRVAITGGTVLQGSAHASVHASAAGRREKWSHYTARPGVLETMKAQPPELVAEGFLSEAGSSEGHADFGAICERLIRKVQNTSMLEGVAPLRFQWTRLRWAACVRPPEDGQDGAPTALAAPTAPTAHLRLGTDLSRALRLDVSRSSVAEIAEFCGDLALHDWILTTTIERLEQLSDEGSKEDVLKIRPLISRLIHLWMPAAHVNAELSYLWEEFERSPGFSRQWNNLVARMRDQVSLHGALGHWVLINHES